MPEIYKNRERKKYIYISCNFPRPNATLFHMFFWTMAEALSHSTRQNVSYRQPEEVNYSGDPNTRKAAVWCIYLSQGKRKHTGSVSSRY